METILCPTDFSPAAGKAIRYVEELAERMPCRIVLLHTIYEPVMAESIPYGGLPYAEPLRDPEYQQAQQEKLEGLRKRLQTREWLMPVGFDTKIRYGAAQETIPQVALEVQADLIVLGSGKSGRLQQMIQGSVIAGVIKRAPCPVLLIPPKAAFRPIQRIVFATDLEGEPFGDVAFVSKLAGLFQAEILFLHILANDQAGTRQQAQQDLARLQKRLPYHNASIHTKPNVPIETGISQFTRHHKADILVMAYHPRSFLQQLFVRDHTRELAYHPTLPILVLHYKR
jgi:nucleotide-binding universal stress UspA family protein